MRRRPLALPTLLAAAIAIAGCNNAGPALSDPAEILTKAVEAMQGAKSVHLEATVDGTVGLDLMGAGQAGDIALTGTTLTMDLDIEAGNAALDLAVPAMLGMTVELIQVGTDSYVRTSFTGDLYMKGVAEDAGIPIDPSDPEASLEELKTWLERPEVDPRKLDDAACGSGTCYQVEIDLSAADLVALMPEAEDVGDGTVVLRVLVEKDSLRPASFAIEVTAGELGDLRISLSLSDWDEDLDIQAPPADQVTEDGELPF